MPERFNGLASEVPKVLIVDDKEPERIVLGKLLASFDIDLHMASSGKEALSLLLRHDFALILLDVNMPIMDGIETAKLIRSNPDTEKVPIIFLTAYDKDDIEIGQGYEVGAIDYIIKPINEEILQSKIKTFIRSYAFEKEKGFERILEELESKNARLQQAEQEARRQAEDANRAKAAAQESRKQIAQQTEELLKYTRELEQFAHVTTHDLRAPIINLDGLVKLFQRRGLVNSENKELMQRMEGSVERIKTTLQDLIDVVSSKKTLKDEVQHIEIGKLFNDILLDHSDMIKEADAEITANFRAAPHINYIPSYLRSILQNLLTNALKYRSPDRQLQITINGDMINDTYCLKVKDNGMGIEERHHDKVFGLFQRIATHVSGKGVGLYITKSQVESMGGAIDFKSEPGVGTEFSVYLKNSPRPRSFMM